MSGLRYSRAGVPSLPLYPLNPKKGTIMSRLPAILAGFVLALAAAWTVAAQTSPPAAATITQTIPITAAVPVTLDDGSVQTVTVPLTVTLNIDVSVDGAASIGAEVEQPAAAEPVADEVALENASDFLPALADMPDGWGLRQEGEASSNEDIADAWPDADAALATLNDLGRLGGYYRNYQAPGLPLTGNATLNFTLLVFETPEGAADAIAFYGERDEARLDSGEVESIFPISVSGLGDAVEAYTVRYAATSEGANDAHDEHTIVFAKGNAVVFVVSRSFLGVGDPAQLIEFAKQIAARLP